MEARELRNMGLVAVLAAAAASCADPSITQAPQPGTPPAARTGDAPSPSAADPSGVPAARRERARVAELTFSGADFYAVPEPLPAGDRGRLMRIQTLQDNDVARIYRVLYRSSSVDGSDVAVSGTIWVPATLPPSTGFPIVAWAPGNNGSGDPCAYSRVDDATEIDYALLVYHFVQAGYVVAYTDYAGHGTRYPYLFAVPESSTHALIDAARAARDLLGDVASARVVVAGLSLGAGAAASTLQLGPAYAAGLDLAGALILEGGGDVADVVSDAMAGGSPWNVVQGIAGWSAAYPDLRASDVLTPSALRDIGSLEETCAAQAKFEGLPTDEVLVADPLEVASWDARLEASRVRQALFPAMFVVAPTSPHHVDGIRRVFSRLCSVSTDLRFATYPFSTHEDVVEDAERDFMDWIRQRFEGQRADGNCKA